MCSLNTVHFGMFVLHYTCKLWICSNKQSYVIYVYFDVCDGCFYVCTAFCTIGFNKSKTNVSLGVYYILSFSLGTFFFLFGCWWSKKHQNDTKLIHFHLKNVMTLQEDIWLYCKNEDERQRRKKTCNVVTSCNC